MSLLSNIKALFTSVKAHERAVVKLTNKAFEEARQAHGFVDGQTIFPEIKTFAPMPSVKCPAPPESEIRVDHSLEVEEKPKLTEPVELLLKAMIERRERFFITRGDNFHCDPYKLSWDIWDVKTGFKFTLKLKNMANHTFYSTESWMTEEDCSAIVDLIRKKNDGIHLGDKEERRLEIVALYKENT